MKVLKSMYISDRTFLNFSRDNCISISIKCHLMNYLDNVCHSCNRNLENPLYDYMIQTAINVTPWSGKSESTKVMKE